uniref:Protein kinase domain-containing protein n=1 Tax=Panagrolaimus davidi TaxID=227884 RepID=A0A914PE65_9BILA
MKQISGQKNIVAMLGCITAGDRICLVLEFCANLDLLHYVKKLQNNNNNNNNNEINLEETQKKIKKEFFIFAWQISHGLEFLASEGVIHRDLAARNILIDADKSAKITDFGLSIQIPIFENVVTCLDTEKLPIKWLSIESLKNHEFSFKTDM